MHILVTGASGFVGGAVVRALLEAGHTVTGLVRSETAVAALREQGADAVLGDVNDAASRAAATARVDGVIHTAFNHDFSTFADNCAADRRVIEHFGALLAGSERPILVTSGTGLIPANAEPDGWVLETARAQPNGSPRAASEIAADAAAARGVRIGIVRLPPSVHGGGDHGFVPLLVKLARAAGRAAYVGDGGNLWPAVHRLDAADLYVRALAAVTPGARFHAVAETGVPFRAIATAIGHGLGVPVVGLDGEAAAAHFGWFAHFAAMHNRADSTATRAALGWTPTGPSLLDDLAGPDYFRV